MKPLPINTADAIQPWGMLDAGFLRNLTNTTPPADYLVRSVASAAVKQSHFDEWFDSTLALVNRVLWPRYDPHRQEWQGESIDCMKTLTQADLQILLNIQTGNGGRRRIDEQVCSPLRSLDSKTHNELFRNEDEARGSKMFEGARFYDRTLDDKTLAVITHLCFEAGDRKMGNINERFKQHLQRPRPMHMALRFQLDNFEYLPAGTSITPSMCSGHCLQGTSHVGALIERMVDDGRQPSPATIEALATWAVDIGDRRVLAGVHYPSDNLCSWIIFLRLLPLVYTQPAAVGEIAKAIADSYVLAQIRDYSTTPEGQCYQGSLAELDRLLPH